MKAEARTLLHTFKNMRPNSANQPKGSQFILIPKGRTFIDRINTAIAQTQRSMELLLSWKRFSRGMASAFAESIESAWARNVKMRVIVEKPVESEMAKQMIQFCRKKPFCQIKFISYCPTVVFGIYDKKEVFIVVHPKTDLPGSPTLWSSNHSLIALAENHFKTLWLTAIKSNFKIPRTP